ncbi:hypothetical protein ACFU7D_27980 [Nocardioides sp. NPDC057577]|uniref:hypothetical protein n=1 Tax=unclassified Nocardioides TaxID=2615069 RepID=UPI00366C554E
MKINQIKTPINGIAMSACGHPELSSPLFTLIGQSPKWATPAAGAFTGAGYGMRVEGLVSPQADAIKVKSHGIRAWSCPTT